MQFTNRRPKGFRQLRTMHNIPSMGASRTEYKGPVINPLPMNKIHGNTKHYVKKFGDSYDGQSAYLYAVWGRLKGLTITVAPVNRFKTINLDAQYRVSIHKNARFRQLTRADWREMAEKEQRIRKIARDVSRIRLRNLRNNPRTMSKAEIQDLEKDAPQLYEKLPRVYKKNIDRSLFK